MNKAEVSSTMWLYGADAKDFNLPLEVQRLFLTERDCIKTRGWIEKMYKELGGR